MRYLTALPVYNEASHVTEVLHQVQRFAQDVLAINDGSSDGTAEVLAAIPNLHVLTHPENRGYGAALVSAFDYAVTHRYDAIVTIDCDGQHEPALIPQLVAALGERTLGDKVLGNEVDIVSGSRYLTENRSDSVPPADRRHINFLITECLNSRLGLDITDAFCGFKAYRTSVLPKFDISDFGYAMPLQLWVQAAAAGMRITEFPIPLIYLDEKRSFGGSLDDAQYRLAHYRKVLSKELARYGFEDCPCEQSTLSAVR